MLGIVEVVRLEGEYHALREPAARVAVAAAFDPARAVWLEVIDTDENGSKRFAHCSFRSARVGSRLRSFSFMRTWRTCRQRCGMKMCSRP